MQLNWIIFPAPFPPTYVNEEEINEKGMYTKGHLIYIPMHESSKSEEDEKLVITAGKL